MLKLTKFLLLSICICFLIVSTNASPIVGLAPEKSQSAIYYYENGNYPEAIKILEGILPNLNTDLDKGIAFNNLALAYYQIGKISKAISNWEKAIYNLKNSSEVEGKVFLVKARLFQSQAYLDLGILDKAVPQLKEIENIEDVSLKSRAKFLLGKSYLLQQNYNRAIEYYQSSLELSQDYLGKISLAKAFFLRAKQLRLEAINTSNNSEAERLNATAREDLAKARAEILPLINFKEDLLTQISARLQYFTIAKYSGETVNPQEYDRTAELLDRLPDSRAKISGSIELTKFMSRTSERISLLSKVIEIAKKIDDRRSLSSAYYELALIREQAENYQQAIELNKSGLVASESAAFESSTSDILFRLLWQRGRIEKRLNLKEKEILSYQQALWNLQSNRGAFAVGHHGLLFRLRDEVKPFLREYVSLLLESNQPDRAIEALSFLKLSELQTYFIDPCFDVFSASDRSDNLPNNLGIDRNKTATIYTFIEPENLKLILKLPERPLQITEVKISGEELERKILNFHNSLGRQGFDYVAPLQELHSLIIKPIETELNANKIENLVFVQDGILRNIPMEVLLSTSEDRYLIEKYQILYLSGLRGEFSEDKVKQNNIFFGVSEARQGLNPLPFVKQEANFVRELLGARVYLNGDFTRANFFDLLKDQNYSTIHLATHGDFQGSAKNSWLLSFDRLMSLEDIKLALLSTKTPAQLLVFSACETAAGNSLTTLGFAGISLRARVSNVMGSLWQVPDDSTSIFMEKFYQELNRGSNLAAAKRTAQIDILQKSKKPLNWGGLILINNSEI